METISAESKLDNLTDNGPSIQAHANFCTTEFPHRDNTVVLYCITLYSTMLYRIVLDCLAIAIARQSNTIRYNMVLYSVMQYNTTVMSLCGNSVVLFRTRETIA